MFTGLVEKKGFIKNASKSGGGLTLSVFVEGFDDLKIGDSIAVDGVCQTVTMLGSDSFAVFVMNETLKLTTLGSLKAGDEVNLERAMPANGRFGGHFVSGHVDGIAELISTKKDGGAQILRYRPTDTNYTKYIVKKGSIALNGVSLTLSEVAPEYFEINLIPHTLENVKFGDRVNVEVDIIAKYVEKFICKDDNKSKIDEKFLMEHGF